MSNPKLNLRTVEHPRGTWIYDGDQLIILPELWAEGQGQACFDEVLCEVVG